METIYGGVVEHSYTKTNISDANCAGHSRKMRGEFSSSKNYSKIDKLTGNFKQRYVDHLRDQSKLTFLIHAPGN